MNLTVTPLYAGLLGLWCLILAARVILQRRASGVSLGTGDDAALERRVRAHANFAEYAPLGLLLLALLEFNGAPGWSLHATGLMFLVGRLLHGYALSFTRHSPLRVPGMVLTFGALALLAIGNVATTLG